MKKIIIIFSIILFSTFAFARFENERAIIARKSPIDFTQYASCMGAWQMTANTGNETDLSGEGETLTETGGSIPTSSDVPSGFSGTSRVFVLADTEHLEHADGGSTDISGANQSLTLYSCFKVDAIATSAEGVLIGKRDTADQRQFYLYVTGTATNEFKITAAVSSDGTIGNTTYCETTITNYAVGSWMTAIFTYDDSYMRVYVNGVLASTPAAETDGIYNGSGPFTIGCYYDSGSPVSYFNGSIFESAIFNAALTSSESLKLSTYGLEGDRS